MDKQAMIDAVILISEKSGKLQAVQKIVDVARAKYPRNQELQGLCDYIRNVIATDNLGLEVENGQNYIFGAGTKIIR